MSLVQSRPDREGQTRPVVAFLVLALGLTWTFDVVVGWWLNGWDLPFVGAARDLGPAVSAIVVTAVTRGRSGVKSLGRATIRWRVKPRWYVFTLVAVPTCYAGAVLSTPGAVAAYEQPATGLLLAYPLLVPAAALIGGPVLEEPAWRGFLLPRLLAFRSPAAASMIVGVIWAGWHATEYLDPSFAQSNGGRGPAAVAGFVITAVSVSILLTWVVAHTGGSVFLAILAHNSVNVAQAITGDLLPGFDASPMRTAAAFGGLALLVLTTTRGRLGIPEMQQRPELGPYPR
jgi:membrane protease YdiL (CAAX protease family)